MFCRTFLTGFFFVGFLGRIPIYNTCIYVKRALDYFNDLVAKKV